MVRIFLVMESDALNSRPFPISKERTVIGRAARTDVRIPIQAVAPHHCEITLDGEELTLRDLGSPQGTLHNGTRVERATLSDTDRVTIGPVTFEVRMPKEREKPIETTKPELLRAQRAVLDRDVAARRDPAAR